jgi:hypothetical protein
MNKCCPSPGKPRLSGDRLASSACLPDASAVARHDGPLEYLRRIADRGNLNRTYCPDSPRTLSIFVLTEGPEPGHIFVNADHVSSMLIWPVVDRHIFFKLPCTEIYA